MYSADDYTLTGVWMTLESNIGLTASNIGPMYALISWWRGKNMASHYRSSRLTGHVSAGRDLDGTVHNDSDRCLCLHAISKPQQSGQVSASASVKTFNDGDVALHIHECETIQPQT